MAVGNESLKLGSYKTQLETGDFDMPQHFGNLQSRTGSTRITVAYSSISPP